MGGVSCISFGKGNNFKNICNYFFTLVLSSLLLEVSLALSQVDSPIVYQRNTLTSEKYRTRAYRTFDGTLQQTLVVCILRSDITMLNGVQE